MPDWNELVRRRLAGLNRAFERDEQIVEELAQHAEDRFRELCAGGVAEGDAQRMALDETTDGAALGRELRAVESPAPPERSSWRWRPLQDVRYGLRTLGKAQSLTAVIVAVLALGIGANAAMFSVLDAMFLRPLRYPEPERLVRIVETPPSGGDMPVAYPDFLDWAAGSRSFASMGIRGSQPQALRGPEGSERVRVAYVSAGYHETLGVAPEMGRGISADDDRAGAPPMAVLSHTFWMSHFGGDRGVIGRTVTVDDQALTIAGVMSAYSLEQGADLFVPITSGGDKWGYNMRENHSGTGVVARLRAGASVEEARTEMKLIAGRLAKAYPGSNGGVGADVIPLRDYLGGEMRQSAVLMAGAVALLLAIACANVAGLLIARAATRQREMAIRIAMGASRPQLVLQLLTESLLLALGGAALGLGAAWAGIAALPRFFPAVVSLGGIGLDWRVTAFSVLAAGLTAVAFGLAPALQFTRPDIVDAIKAGGRGSRASVMRQGTRRALVVGQVALAAMLVTGAGLLMRSLILARGTSTGFDPSRVAAAQIVAPDRKDADLANNLKLIRDVIERMSAVPGVEAAGAVDNLPFDNPDSFGNFYRDDRPAPAPDQLPSAAKATATAGYFRVMGIPLIKGRFFEESDGRMPPVKRDIPSVLAYLRSVELVAVINETMARRYWPGEDPLGKTFRFGPPSLQGPRVRIIGVAGDARQFGLDRPAEPQYFFFANQFPQLDVRLVVKTSRETPGLAGLIRRAVAEAQPAAVVTSVQPMDALIGKTLGRRRNQLGMLGLFSGIALLLAALGLYATMAFIVAQRTQEIGVRMALGAAASQVRLMVVREAAAMAGIGLAIGLAAAWAAKRAIASMLYGVTGADLLTYAGAALVLLLAMLAASYAPARRASRVDPMVALRLG